MDEEELLLALGYLVLKRRIRRAKQLRAKYVRKMWVKDIFKERERKGIFHTLVQEMTLGDRESYFRYIYSVFIYSF